VLFFEIYFAVTPKNFYFGLQPISQTVLQTDVTKCSAWAPIQQHRVYLAERGDEQERRGGGGGKTRRKFEENKTSLVQEGPN
jgi:hypothetical protein